VSARTAFEDVVVGAGSAGCVVAARLSEAGRDVCLVEAGPDYGAYTEGRWPADILDSRWLALSHAWETDREDRSQLRARIMGGCSAHNACVVLAGAPADYDEWGHGWSHAAIEPYLRRAEQMLRVRRLAAEELSPWHGAFARAAGADAILHPTNVVDGVRWNAAFAYVDPVRERLTVLADTLVDRVLLAGDRAVGVQLSVGELRAERVILSAGAYGSPGILLRSEIGAQRGLPVGEGLLDHVGVGLAFDGTARLQHETAEFERDRPLSMAQVTVEARSNACEEGVCDLYLFPAVDPAVDGVYEISVAAFAMKPRSRGSVRLTSREPSAPLAIDHGFLSDARDVDVLVEGVEAIRALAARGTVSDYVAREIRPGPEVDAADHVRAAARGFFHPTGTCAIGRVVDGDGRVLGIDGLNVVDASVMPTIPRANTNLTTIALAERLAERMLTG
jgi:choline dehydrogenase-like flavoprotein